MAFARRTGLGPEDYERLVGEFCDASSATNRCHTHFGPITDALKHEVLIEGEAIWPTIRSLRARLRHLASTPAEVVPSRTTIA